jgi:hypothetical protein
VAINPHQVKAKANIGNSRGNGTPIFGEFKKVQ